jgi:hypothetical protein
MKNTAGEVVAAFLEQCGVHAAFGAQTNKGAHPPVYLPYLSLL